MNRVTESAQFRLTIGFRRAVKRTRFEIRLKYSKHVDFASMSLLMQANVKSMSLEQSLIYIFDFTSATSSSECRLRTERVGTVAIEVMATGQGQVTASSKQVCAPAEGHPRCYF